MPVKRIQRKVAASTVPIVRPPTPRPPRAVQPSLLPQPRPVAPAAPDPDDFYPYEDGIAMASSPEQGRVIMDIRHALENHFDGREDVYIGMDMLVYDKQHDTGSCLASDVFVAFDVRGPVGKSYRIWEVGKPPDIVWEFGSASTAKGDAKEKKQRYRRWGVQEYWLYDPHGGLHRPRLQGFQLVDGRYVRLRAARRGRGLRAVKSPLLGLELRFDGLRLRLWNPATAEYVRTPRESERDRQESEKGRLRERAGRLEERAKRLEADSRARAEAARADTEAQARREAEGRAAELERRLAELTAAGSGPRG